MKILFVAHNFPPVSGGISQIMLTMAKSLPPDEVMVLAPWGTNTSSHRVLNAATRETAARIDSALPFPVHRSDYSMQSKLKTLFSVVRFFVLTLWLAKRYKVDLVYFSHCYPTGVAGLFLGFFRMPYAVHTYGSELVRQRRGPAGRLRLRVLQKAFRVSAISRWGKDYLVSMGVPGEKIVILHPKIELERFAPPQDLDAFRKREQLSGKQVILSVGHLTHRKGQHLVIEAMPALLKQFPDAMYVVAGAGPDDKRLKDLAAERGVVEHVLFPGNRDIVAFYHACDVFILPSLYIKKPFGDIESFGIVYIEAGACGKPVIGSNNGGIPDAVADGESGLLIETGSVEAIADALRKLLGNQALRERLGRQGYERVLREFTIEKYKDDLGELILEPFERERRA
ncbi:MAG TPA: glycosyltransferase family 4 protein [Candidatus Bathyarchaeia archaeon]|nr:glycosyltransferase family 4 protein [Candidatus Bathyarchaeia archaeon]